MSDNQKEQHKKEEPIIIKKRKGHGAHGAHGGAWKVAYADFVTAMMAFFIVMWILGQSEETKKMVSAYFEDPGAFNFMTGKRTIPIDLNLQPEPPGKGGKKEAQTPGGKKEEFFFVIPPENNDSLKHKIPLSKIIQAEKDSAQAAEHVKKIGEEIKKLIEKEISQRPDLKELLSSIKIEMTKEGLRIELIESKENLFFEIGSSRLSEKAKEILIQLSKQIGKLPNFVDIEGHTDSRKYTSNSGYTNWELSADRANSARRLLETNGLWEGQVQRVTGFSDKKLRNPNNPFDVSNRRVSILIRQLNSEDFLKQTDVQG